MSRSTILLAVLSLTAACDSSLARGGNPGFAAFMAEHQARNPGPGQAPPPGQPSTASASQVCERITMSDIRLACMQGSANRTYTPDELQTCAGMMMNEQKRDCMLTSGKAAPTPAAAAPAAPAPAVGEPSVPMRSLKFQNFYAVPVTRIVWRPAKTTRFRDVKLPRPVETSTSTLVEVGKGVIDFCFEFNDGQRVLSTDMDDTLDFYLVPNTERRRKPGTCVDTAG